MNEAVYAVLGRRLYFFHINIDQVLEIAGKVSSLYQLINFI